MFLLCLSLFFFCIAWKNLKSLNLGTALFNSLYSLDCKLDQLNHRMEILAAELQVKLDLKIAQKAIIQRYTSPQNNQFRNSIPIRTVSAVHKKAFGDNRSALFGYCVEKCHY